MFKFLFRGFVLVPGGSAAEAFSELNKTFAGGGDAKLLNHYEGLAFSL